MAVYEAGGVEFATLARLASLVDRAERYYAAGHPEAVRAARVRRLVHGEVADDAAAADVRRLLAAGLCVVHFPDQQAIETLSATLVAAVVAAALTPLLEVERLPLTWTIALAEIASPELRNCAEWWRARVRGTPGGDLLREDYPAWIAAVARPENEIGIVRLLGDMADPARGGSQLATVCRAISVEEKGEAIGSAGSLDTPLPPPAPEFQGVLVPASPPSTVPGLLQWTVSDRAKQRAIVGLSAAGAGVIGNRADWLVMKAWELFATTMQERPRPRVDEPDARPVPVAPVPVAPVAAPVLGAPQADDGVRKEGRRAEAAPPVPVVDKDGLIAALPENAHSGAEVAPALKAYHLAVRERRYGDASRLLISLSLVSEERSSLENELVNYHRELLRADSGLASSGVQRVMHLAQLGRMLLLRKDLAAAFNVLNEALPLARSAGTTQEECDILRRLSDVARLSNRPQPAIDYAQRALAIAQAAGYTEGERGASSLLGSALVWDGNFRDALPYLARAVTLAQSMLRDESLSGHQQQTLGRLLKESQALYNAAQLDYRDIQQEERNRAARNRRR